MLAQKDKSGGARTVYAAVADVRGAGGVGGNVQAVTGRGF